MIVTIALISCSLIVYRQIDFINNKDLGLDRKNIICLHKANLLENKAQLFKEEMLMNPEFISGTISSYLPVLSISYNYRNGVVPDGNIKESIGLPHWAVDFDYINTLKLKIIKGRGFSREFLTDSSALILNEAAVKEFGWDDPFDHFITKSAFRNGVDSEINFKIIGVVKDFHFESLQNNIAPLLLYINGKSGNIISFRYKSDNVNKVVQLLESKWKEFLPNQPFKYSFLDEQFNSLYFREQRIGKIMVIFAVFSIVIASLGLFGLSTFLAVKRTKEIGIRKVNGASVFSIFFLFSMDTVRLCIISFVIAIPVTWYFMDNWLNNFAYRINIQWPIFLISGFIAFTIAILTISYQGYRASVRNPVDALKYE